MSKGSARRREKLLSTPGCECAGTAENFATVALGAVESFFWRGRAAAWKIRCRGATKILLPKFTAISLRLILRSQTGRTQSGDPTQ